MVPAVAVGDADGPGLFLRPLVPPVHVEAGGVHMQGLHREGEGLACPLGYLQEELRHPRLVEGVQHAAHTVIVEEPRGDALPQEPLRGLTFPIVAEEVEGGRHKAQGVQNGRFQGHPRAHLFPQAGAHPFVHQGDQPNTVHDTGDQAQVAEVVHL